MASHGPYPTQDRCNKDAPLKPSRAPETPAAIRQGPMDRRDPLDARPQLGTAAEAHRLLQRRSQGRLAAHEIRRGVEKRV